MITTLSLCPVCYKKIVAHITNVDGMAVMSKVCDVHGPFSAVVEKDFAHVSNFYREGTLGRNNTIIIHAHNQCNMSCSWCYYDMGKEAMHDAYYYDQILGQYKGKFNLLLSGGEPTERPDYFTFVRQLHELGWTASSITNMVNLGNAEFFNKTMTDDFRSGDTVRFAMSMQHPKNYPESIFEAKMKALENLERAKVKAMCCMFSIQSLDELAWIREFYNHTKGLYGMLRVRTMFANWANKGDQHKIFLSDLHREFLRVFGDLMPTQATNIEHSNMYCLYMKMADGMNVSLSSAPTVENVDYHQCSRPVYMLAMDGRCYPVPLAQIINEGINLGWKDGFKLHQGGSICG